MIDLPASVLKKSLASEFKRGKVLRTEYVFKGVPSFKRLILLNKDFEQEDIYFVFTTSKVDWYKRNSDVESVRNHFIFVPRGETVDNQNEDMVINCRKVEFIKKEKLFENLKNRKLQLLDEIPTHILKDIDRIIQESDQIPEKTKIKIL